MSSSSVPARGGLVDFSKRLSRVAALATWGGVTLAAVGAVVLDHEQGDIRLSLVVFLAWQGLAVVNAIALTLLPMLQEINPHVRRHIAGYRGLLLLSTLVAVSGSVAVSGGIRGPFWVLLLPSVLFAATTMPQLQAILLGLLAGAGLVVASAVAHTLNASTAAWLVLVVPVFPAIAWFNGTLASSVWAMRAHAKAERDELQARVEALSQVLAQAADGDLAVNLTGDDDAMHAGLHMLTDAF